MSADQPNPSARSDVDPFVVMDVMREANRLEAAGRSIMHLEVGQPGAATPDTVRSIATETLNAGPLAYTDALGLPSLRARVARYYAEHHSVTVDPERVVVTAGSSAAFILTFLACFESGDRVGVPEPGYPAYRNTLRALGCEPVSIPVGPETDWVLTPNLIDEAEAKYGRLKGVLVASPSNPTGAMLTGPQMAALVKHNEAADRWFLSDEIYHRITYGRSDVSALEAGAEAIVINSFSKYYCMTGWRLGWAVVPERLVRPIERLAQNLFISPPTLSQIAAERAFDETTCLDENVAIYAENRRLLLRELPKAGITSFAPADGAFYLYADVSHLTDDSAAFCSAMLEEAGVAATPGADFDPTHGYQYVRFSFAGKTADMAEAARRLQEWLGA
ncbi:putative N-acetyl-LL-diaminopimelate aminotransferase [Rhodobiaceae bacterium]|nr:putative N-acetyl-LL-diaminopimelate aminotransferase [Rhodobiaceae bacterium]